MTTPIANLAAALAKVQAELPKIERDRTVEVETKKGDPYSYSYVTLSNLSDAVLPLLAKHGLSFVAMPGAGSDGKMCVRYQLMHDSGETLAGEFPISGEGGIQMIGGRITYARRYCLAAVVGVAADEDDESRLSNDGAPRTAQRAPARRQTAREAQPAVEGQPTAQRAQRPAGGRAPLPGEPDKMTAKQGGMMHALFGKVDMTDRGDRIRYVNEVLAEKVGPDRQVESSSDLTKREAGFVIDQLQAWAGQLEPAADGA